jgi:hypothetical protein
LAFKGEVLLVHGDTHWQRVDQPLRHSETKLPLANFTRAETFGYPVMGWVKVMTAIRNFSALKYTRTNKPLRQSPAQAHSWKSAWNNDPYSLLSALANLGHAVP